MRLRKRDKQYADAEHNPGLVGIPEGADRRDHHVFFLFIRQRQQDADTEIKAIEYHVHEQRKAHGEYEKHRQEFSHQPAPSTGSPRRAGNIASDFAGFVDR